MLVRRRKYPAKSQGCESQKNDQRANGRVSFSGEFHRCRSSSGERLGRLELIGKKFKMTRLKLGFADRSRAIFLDDDRLFFAGDAEFLLAKDQSSP